MRLAWSRPLPAAPVGLSLAREPGTALVWDAEGALARYDRDGRVLLRQPAPGSLALAAVSDDGRSVAAASKRGRVWLLTPELVPVWERTVSARPTALALDHEGQQVAVADETGRLRVFDRGGREAWVTTTPRPLAQLAFVPEAARLVGCAEFGLVAAFDDRGDCSWRDGLVAHVGALAVSGDGQSIVLACFTDGLHLYALSGARRGSLPAAAPARLVALSYTGETVVTVGLERDVKWRNATGQVQAEMTLSANPVALAVEALGQAALTVLASNEIVRLERLEEPRT